MSEWTSGLGGGSASGWVYFVFYDWCFLRSFGVLSIYLAQFGCGGAGREAVVFLFLENYGLLACKAGDDFVFVPQYVAIDCYYYCSLLQGIPY